MVDLSPRRKFEEDKRYLLEHLAEPTLMARTFGETHLIAEDELTRGLRQMSVDKELPVWLVFATQVFLDIHHVVGTDVDHGMSDLRNTGTIIKDSIQRMFKFRQDEDLHNDIWPPDNDVLIRSIIQDIDRYVFEDVLGDLKKRLFRDRPESYRYSKPFAWYIANPIYCGLLCLSLQMDMQESGIAFVNAWGAVLWSAHLYNCMRQEYSSTHQRQILETSWPDMDILINFHSAERIFVGNPPTNIIDAEKRLLLTMGYSAETFSPQALRRRRGAIEARRGPRGLCEMSPVAKIFRSRYARQAHQATAQSSLKELEDYFKLAKAKDAIPTDRPKTSKILKRLADKAVVSPFEMLENIGEALENEMPELMFDYFEFHLKCWTLLTVLHNLLRPTLTEKLGVEYLETASQLPFVVPYIFRICTESIRHPSIQVPARPGSSRTVGVADRTLLLKTAATVEVVLRETDVSNYNYKILKVLCPGFEYDPLVPENLKNLSREEYDKRMKKINDAIAAQYDEQGVPYIDMRERSGGTTGGNEEGIQGSEENVG